MKLETPGPSRQSKYHENIHKQNLTFRQATVMEKIPDEVGNNQESASGVGPPGTLYPLGLPYTVLAQPATIV